MQRELPTLLQFPSNTSVLKKISNILRVSSKLIVKHRNAVRVVHDVGSAQHHAEGFIRAHDRDRGTTHECGDCDPNEAGASARSGPTPWESRLPPSVLSLAREKVEGYRRR